MQDTLRKKLEAFAAKSERHRLSLLIQAICETVLRSDAPIDRRRDLLLAAVEFVTQEYAMSMVEDMIGEDDAGGAAAAAELKAW
jgi:predicted transcriptional regulator